MRKHLIAVPVVSFLGSLTALLVLAGWGPAQTNPVGPAKQRPLADRLRSPLDNDRPLLEKLRSPRETIKTLYFAVIIYDLFPQMIQDARACLDLDPAVPRPSSEDANLLALDLEYVLQTLCLALSTVPDIGMDKTITVYDADGFKIALTRSEDGGWRFSNDTLQRLPEMRRLAQERRRQRLQDVSGFREGCTDPRATFRQFLSDVAHGDYYAAARALDLSALGSDQRHDQGPVLAQKLAVVIQHRGYVFRQEVPDQADGPPYTWHSDQQGRIVLERLHQPDGKSAWLFNRQTVRNIARMYTAALAQPPAAQYERLGLVVPPLEQAAGPQLARKRPEDVPQDLGSPRAVLRGFFRTMQTAETNDARLADALNYLDLDNVAVADRGSLGSKLAVKLESILRKVQPDLLAVPDDWNAQPQVLGEAHGVRIEILRQRDGCWRFSQSTVARIPEMFDKLAGKTRTDKVHASHLDSARDTMITFETAAGMHDFALAGECLDLSELPVGAHEALRPILAYKLKYLIDRIGRIFVEEISENPEGPRYILYRGELGRVALDRRAHEPRKGQWLFTSDTVQRIEPMFRAVLRQPVDESQQDALGVLNSPSPWEAPGVWLRLQLPRWLQVRLGWLELYQWLGLGAAMLASLFGARLLLAGISHVVTWVLHRSGSQLTSSFVARTLQPLTWLAGLWLSFELLTCLDLTAPVAAALIAAEKFLSAALVGWLGLRLIDLGMGVYTNSEFLRPHRSLGDLIAPVTMRICKAGVLLVVAVYMIYQVGEISLLTQFLTGLGVAGLAASLAAQDAMKSFFGTLLLIGERVFKIGDRIIVDGKEGVVEQVGFRSTRLRTSEDSLLTIPNSVIASASIDNMGARSHRRVSTTILISLDTALDRLLQFRERLHTWLVEQPHVVRDRVGVHVHQVTEHGVEMNLGLFLTATSGADEAGLREALNCQILRLAEELGVGLAPNSAPAAVEGGPAGEAILKPTASKAA
jgi:MscS family membrane protein